MNKPVYAQLSDDGTSIWGAVAEKAYAKVIGNYLKIDGGFEENGVRILTGNPIFTYSLTGNINLSSIFSLL